MNVIIFLVLVIVSFLVMLYIAIMTRRKKAFGSRFFWVSGIMAIGYSIIFTGILDRIFVVFFAVFMVYARFLANLTET